MEFFIVLLIILSVLWFFGFFRSTGQEYRDRKGRAGERIVHGELLKLGESYTIFHDIMLPSLLTTSRTTQIDHIAISKHGIFVIETKNYRGIIEGGEMQRNWIQRFRKSQRTFFNPLRQNDIHIEAVKRILPDLAFPTIYSIITFSNNSSIRELSIKSPNTTVTYFRHLKKNILSVQTETLSSDDIHDIVEVIRTTNEEVRKSGEVQL